MKSSACAIFLLCAVPCLSMELNPGEAALPAPFLPPVVFSDAEEDGTSSTRVSTETVDEPGGASFLRLTASIADNRNLGYQYAGVAFPLEEALSIEADAGFTLLLRSDAPLAVQVNHRDGNRTNHFGDTFTLAGGEWETIAIDAARLSGNGLLREVAVVLSRPGEATLDIRSLSLPVAASPTPAADAPREGMPYHWRAPGAFFADPVPISDRDESSRSESSVRLRPGAADLPGRGTIDVMEMSYTVRPNPELGYSYGGLAIPFHAPMELLPGGGVHFRARANPPLERLEVTLRDTGRRRASRHVAVPGGTDWTEFRLPGARFTGIDADSLESIAFVVLAEGEGSVEIADLRLPVHSTADNLTALERLVTRPKVYTSSAMARLVAAEMDRPLLLLATPDDSAEEQWNDLIASDAWRGILMETVNTIAGPGERGNHGAETPALRLLSPGGEELLEIDILSEGAAGRVRSALTEHQPEPHS